VLIVVSSCFSVSWMAANVFDTYSSGVPGAFLDSFGEQAYNHPFVIASSEWWGHDYG